MDAPPGHRAPSETRQRVTALYEAHALGLVKLAVFYQMPGTRAGFPYSGPFTLAVYSVPAGTLVRSWTGTDPFHGSLAYGSNGPPDSNSLLSWTSDGRHLAFDYRSSTDPNSLYLREVNLFNRGTTCSPTAWWSRP